jgi:alkyl hydroperoxide reductase 1
MAPLKVGDSLPDGVKFEYVPHHPSSLHSSPTIKLRLTHPRWAPITDSDPTACGRPQEYNASKEWANKKVVLFSVPGAFTPGCQAYHLPPYISQRSKFSEKGVDIVATIASNDAWVMNAWGKVNGVKGDEVLFLSDTKTFFSKEHGWPAGMGDRK